MLITNTNKKVICIKDIPSNLIEEAIFILKNDMDMGKNTKHLETKKKIILQETKDFLRTYEADLERERRKSRETIEKKKRMKLAMGMIAFFALFVMVSIIILL